MIASLILIGLALLGAPLFAVIAAGALWAFHQSGDDLAVVAIEFYRLAEMPMLVAIPLFTFAGYVLSESGAPTRLVNLSRALLGWLPGGLAIVALAACALFTAFTGASGITIIALGTLLYPAMAQEGYPERFNLGLITTSGSLGLLFAPSLPLILYAVIAQQLGVGRSFTINEMFLAGLLPGLLMLVLLSAWSLWINRRQPRHGFSWRQLGAAAFAARWEIPLPFLVLGGTYSGYFAVSEAAAVTVVYVLIVEMLLYREIPISRVPGIMREAMVLVGALLVILGVSMASTNYLIEAAVPSRLFSAMQHLVSDPLSFLLLLNLLLLALSTLLNIFSALVILVPLLLPVAVSYGVDPVHLGVIFLANMQIGYFMPPMGMDLFIASYRFKRPVMELYRATWPFFVILFACVLIITYWPALSLALTGTSPAGGG
jgi:tripartite ATP-independent transporter DctM subunit